MQFVDNIKNILWRQFKGFRKRTDISSNGACLVLLYHRVSLYETDPQLLCVTPIHFEEQVQFLRSDYNLLNVDQFYDIISKKKKFPERSVLVTFDDGYADNLLFALPILEKYSAEALFYICPGNIDSDREFWWDEVERHLLLSSHFPELFKLQIGEIEFTSSKEIVDRMKLYHDILPVLRKMDFRTRDIVLEKISAMTGNTEPRESHRSMTWIELNTMALSNSAVIGAHTVHHPSLASCTVDEQQKEIEVSKYLLQEKLNMNVEHFSYPFGTRLDFNDDTIQLVKDSGFKMAAANFPYVANRESDLYAVPRFLVRDWDLHTFIKELKSFAK